MRRENKSERNRQRQRLRLRERERERERHEYRENGLRGKQEVKGGPTDVLLEGRDIENKVKSLTLWQ